MNERSFEGDAMSWKDIMKRNSKMVSFAIRNGLDPYTTTKDGKKELKTSETLAREARQKNADRKRER